MVKTIEEILNHSIYDRYFSAEQKQEVTKAFKKVSYYLEYDGQQNWIVRDDGTPICEKNKIVDYMSLPEAVEYDLTARERARWKSGLPLETCVHIGLSAYGVPHKYNPLTFAHYAKATSLVCDLHLEYLLIECTNPKESTWMNNQIMLSKIEYFKRVDKEHSKLWVIVTSFTNFYKKTQQAIKDNDVLVIVIGKRIHKRNYLRYHTKVGATLKQLNELARNYKSPTQEVLEYIGYYKDTQTEKNDNPTIYVNYIWVTLEELRKLCVCIFEGIDREFRLSFNVAG